METSPPVWLNWAWAPEPITIPPTPVGQGEGTGGEIEHAWLTGGGADADPVHTGGFRVQVSAGDGESARAGGGTDKHLVVVADRPPGPRARVPPEMLVESVRALVPVRANVPARP